jgi:enoyl-CoA hydratase
MAWESVLYEVEGPVAKLTMNRPEVLNAQDQQLLGELLEAFDTAAADDNVRVIILAGAGRSFSAGHDLGSPRSRAYQASHPRKPGAQGIMEYEEKYFVDWCMHVRDLPKPTIAQVQGFCIIGGWMIASACDLIVAAEDAVFSDRAARWAAPSGEFNTYVYDLGPRKAKELLFTGDYVSAPELYRLGMLNKVVPAAELESATMAFAQQIARTDGFLLKLVKRSVNEVVDAMGFRSAMRTQHYLHLMTHAHYRIPDVPPVVPRAEGMSLKEWAQARDGAYESGSAAAGD